MIPANELRIGNWISFNGVENYKVEGVTRYGVLVYNHAVRLKYFALDLAQGIPLTEEILLKRGWQYNNGKTSGDLTKDTISKMDIDFIMGELKIKSHYEEGALYRPLPINHLHQLQNLYYALTGEELEISR